jgi:DNA-binding MarR family transcriptional regulator
MAKRDQTGNAIGYKVNKANTVLKAFFQQTILDSGNDITPEQWGLINYLISNPAVKQSEIAKVTYRDQTSITRMLDGMEKKNLITREVDKTDRRVFNIRATDHAKDIYNSILPYAKKYNDTFKKIFSDDECEVFIEKLDRLTAAISDYVK